MAESLMIAILLGLYEMITAGEAHHGYHTAHAGGVAAILCIRNSPLDLLAAVRGGLPLAWNGIVRVRTALSSSILTHDLLIRSSVLLERADVMLANSRDELSNLRILRYEARALNRELVTWQDAQVDHSKHTAIGCVNHGETNLVPATGLWPGRIDTYSDLYVATVWNTIRAVQLLLVDLVLNLSKAVNDNQDDAREQLDAHRLLQDIVSSIPYHLAEDLHGFLRDVDEKLNVMQPGRDVGGLLLMHPIYVVSKLLFVPPLMREYIRGCLAWIGESMGIGQASLFAKVSISMLNLVFRLRP
ncbi:MAG: hypothetical protein M1822_009418 [Bathelium mastoideum]|nr:MAG: hypothetical protein M1822_009418 [Bathelium mastoideum]